ncbi:MAG: hypothetical protein OEW50_11955 [Gammaproteobacteria bacterium]|nr:hypothetical protein [Gammaproteobacteria bacterium]
MTRPRLRVALPWLQPALAAAVASETLPALDAMCWLGGRGQLQTSAGTDWREWLLQPMGGAKVLEAAPAGPTLAARYGHATDGTGSWCVAHPVHLAAGLDHVRMSALDAASPTTAEAEALAATIGAHFGAEGPAVVAFIDGAWLLRFANFVECTTQSPDSVAGHDVHDAMPAGRDGARIRSLMNEIQMLLHDHAVNARRERARQLPINGWWLWGFGAHSHPAGVDTRGWAMRSDDPWLRALWPAAVAPVMTALEGDTLIAMAQPPSPDNGQALATVDAGLFRWLATLVREGRIGRLDLLAGDRELSIMPASRWAFWRRPLAVSGWLQ